MKKYSMKTKIGTMAAAGLLLAVSCSFGAQAAGEVRGVQGAAGYGPASEILEKYEASEAMELPWGLDANTIKGAEEFSQLLVVVGQPGEPAGGHFAWYERGEDGRLSLRAEAEAVTGLNGISSQKKEGDKKTPSGLYSFTMAFGLKEDPGSILPYHQVEAGDWWVDDSSSAYYNRLVNDRVTEKSWNSGEILIHQSPHYNYALALNYNEACVPGEGSAIFLHCPKTVNTSTSGCITVPEETMRELICSVDAGTRILVVEKAEDLAQWSEP